MTRKKGKSINFDVIVKFFLQHYDIPTRTDVDRLIERLDRLERLIRASSGAGRRGVSPGTRRSKSRSEGGKPVISASDQVLAVIKRYKKGAGFAEIKDRTGFGEKKIRNILYRLHRLEKIERKDRGVYVQSI